MWWSGELNNKSGWFPKSYVKIQEPDQSPVQQPAAVVLSPTQPETVEPTMTSSVPNQGELYEASYSYQSPEPGDLTFLQGDFITVTKSDGEWWTGTHNDKTGIFPANYVTKCPTERTPSAQPMDVSTASMDISSQSQLADGSSQLGDNLSSQSTLKLSPKKAEIAQVVAQYKATGPEQLSLTPNQLIQVRKKSPSGWWEGELQVRGQKRRIGWFPANYVKVLSSNTRSTPDSKSPTPGAQDGVARCPTPVSLPHPTSAPAVEQVIALYPYQAQHEDELAFTKSAVINVINKDNADWWKGEFNGLTGVFPSNYVQPLSSQDLNSSTSSASGVDGSSASEQKRQMHINELMSSEESYRKDLTTVVEVFCKILNPVLTPEEIQVMFINWKDIRMCSTKLVKSWRVRREMTKGTIYTVGDILCENLPHMSPYVRYCSCQLTAAALLQKKSESDPRFKESHKKCVQDPRTGGMPLSSFLLKPMQRITKYPLLIEKVLQHTPEDHVDHPNLQEALTKANELCNQVNESVRETENSDRLEWMQGHILCEGLNEKLTFNSVTNCLGPRKYLHSGTLHKAKSGKELVGFLCSDFLLLTQPERHLGAVANIFSFDARTNNMTFKLYRNPIFLNDIMIGKVSENEPETQTFQLSHIDRIYTLKANSTVERDLWLKKIQVASKHYLDTERKKREKAHSVSIETGSGCGRLTVLVMEGSRLIAADVGGKSDPYCEVSIGAQEHKTKVIENTLNPRWNASMQFTVKDIRQDVLCITVYDRDLFTPNDFLGRTEVRIEDIYNETQTTKGPITKHMKLLEVESGEVLVKLDLQLYKDSD